MRKLSALVRHILEETGLPPEQVRAYADQGDLYPIGRDRGPLRPEPGADGEPRQQVELGLLKYDGVIQIERYPGAGADFCALITAWLADCDPQRDGLEDPAIDVDLNIRGGDSDVQIAVEFEERLAAVEDPEGNIPFNGKRWTLTPAVITPVERLVGLDAVNSGAGTGPA